MAFSVMDVLNINESHQSVETINGKIFNTSVLRKLRLFPAHTGKLTIDEMQLQNTVEFNDSVTGQKISVGKALPLMLWTSSLKSLPLMSLQIFPAPLDNLRSLPICKRQKLALNAVAQLVVSITGRGNFIQFGLPASFGQRI
jgi:hypothetical protein